MKALLLLTTVFPVMAASLLAFTDDFNDGNDDGWTRLDPLAGAGIAEPAEFSFPDGVYRIQPAIPAVGAAGPGRVFSYLADEMFSDFYVAVDIVAWEEIDQAFGILGRGDNLGLGTTTGYVCNYNPNQSGGQPTGQFQINYVEGEAAPSDSTIAAANIELIQGHSYRMVFVGKGAKLTGSLYDLTDLTKPVAFIETEDGDFRAELYPTGFVGVFNFYRGDATSEAPDSTFDNFIREVENPHAATWPVIGPDVAGKPYVTALSPASGANFAHAGDGLSSTIQPGGESPVMPESVHLTLNGADVSSDLTVAPTEGGGIQASFAGLEPATVYSARLTASTAAGGELIQEWRFDTFSIDVLADPSALVIEAEDYNFESGQFVGDPVPGSYLDKFGEVEIDYFDFDGSAHSEFRVSDFVGMEPIQGGVPPEILLDTLRPEFVAAAETDYAVIRTEAGEWLNYTREIAPADYQVYLRTACLAPQEVHLDLVTGDPTKTNQATSRLGSFRLTSTAGGQNFAFFQLTDDQGTPVSLSLGGLQTLHLTVGGDDQQFETKFSLMLNYLLLVPAAGSQQTFQINPVTFARDAGVTLTWPTIPNRSYAVEFSQTLQEPSWLELADIVAEEATTSFTDASVANGAKSDGYYRVRRVE